MQKLPQFFNQSEQALRPHSDKYKMTNSFCQHINQKISCRALSCLCCQRTLKGSSLTNVLFATGGNAGGVGHAAFGVWILCNIFDFIVKLWKKIILFFFINFLWLYYAVLEKGGILICNCRSFCRPSVVRSISFDPFTWSIPNLVQGLLLINWFSGHMFKGQGQTTREPSVLSTLYILIPCLLASDRFFFYREDKPEFGTMEGHICF